jgi:4-hydroxymandelate oxidase
VGTIEHKWKTGRSRRQALAGLGSMLAASPLLHAQLDPRPIWTHRRTPGLDEMLVAFDFEPVMYANLPQATYDYTAHGDGSEASLRRTRQAFDWVDLVPAPSTGPRVDPNSVDLSTRILDLRLKYPILIAPTAAQVALHPEGEAGMYRAGASCANTPTVLSNNSTQPVEQVAKAANGQLWWQFYPRQDLDASRELLDRAQAAGCTAIVVTVDQQASFYERSQRGRNLGGSPRGATGRGGGGGAGGRGGRGAGPAGGPAAGPVRGPALYRVGTGRLWYTWQYLDDIRPFIKGPMLVKGILTAEDARMCVERGIDGIIVSNHGGRSMDYGPAPLEALPEIVSAVNGRIPIIVDSGFRRGSDVLKALALGASAVMLGRATRWALGAFGPAGVQKLLNDVIFPELVNATAAAGKTTLASIDRSIIRTSWP